MKIKRLIVGELETNCYLLISKKEAAIIDPGGEAGKILKEIESSKAKVKYIINTHCHLDHILANKELSEKTGAAILSGKKENVSGLTLKDGDKIKIGKVVLKIIHTPGHAKESICLLGKNFIFTGDTLFKDGYGRTDLPGGSQMELEESLQKLSKIIKPGMAVYPGHGNIFERL